MVVLFSYSTRAAPRFQGFSRQVCEQKNFCWSPLLLTWRIYNLMRHDTLYLPLFLTSVLVFFMKFASEAKRAKKIFFYHLSQNWPFSISLPLCSSHTFQGWGYAPQAPMVAPLMIFYNHFSLAFCLAYFYEKGTIIGIVSIYADLGTGTLFKKFQEIFVAQALHVVKFTSTYILAYMVHTWNIYESCMYVCAHNINYMYFSHMVHKCMIYESCEEFMSTYILAYMVHTWNIYEPCLTNICIIYEAHTGIPGSHMQYIWIMYATVCAHI